MRDNRRNALSRCAFFLFLGVIVPAVTACHPRGAEGVYYSAVDAKIDELIANRQSKTNIL